MLQLNNKLPEPQVFSLFNLPVHLLDDYIDWLEERLKQQIGTHVVTINAEMTMLAEADSNLASIIRQANLVVPDGAGVVLYLRLHGIKQNRCPGIELAESLLNRLEKNSNPELICFYGGKPGVAELAAETWQQKIPRLSIMQQHGYLSGEQEQQWLKSLQAAQPPLIFVGLGVPRQELWIQKYRHLCPNSIWIGVGGSFDIWAGNKTRAPLWLRNNNLEWSYRLYQEPWRWKRMLVLPKFLFLSLLGK
ncbi:exopolysaccharide biosynthesis protein, WecB/TagA/CpsF family [Xenococcus sp. PCC 7305]|uniref:WecB/TagA/CpsF family glycosyltransferase n=1 Tax=Xenococcus sp. PCC 7305 TaxID=102125 RepID=UPI0002AC3517|nr:WecB/TagA/CpsF family glycosyltransferase [Xenococcus sp. PCC 7305]ELS01065.1 exopolysaccharide biosynthesis protein, WecB/TagA/CpsF family [Xenococcus sp. PCC 7305]